MEVTGPSVHLCSQPSLTPRGVGFSFLHCLWSTGLGSSYFRVNGLAYQTWASSGLPPPTTLSSSPTQRARSLSVTKRGGKSTGPRAGMSAPAVCSQTDGPSSLSHPARAEAPFHHLFPTGRAQPAARTAEGRKAAHTLSSHLWARHHHSRLHLEPTCGRCLLLGFRDKAPAV